MSVKPPIILKLPTPAMAGQIGEWRRLSFQGAWVGHMKMGIDRPILRRIVALQIQTSARAATHKSWLVSIFILAEEQAMSRRLADQWGVRFSFSDPFDQVSRCIRDE